ncbi:hypothetical protein VaNZ11_007084 [Volvox africanus]|uniref:Glucosidase 2 subunit beta n=1 Tax=Volvox africanus TaxID=51714 RepID=A0ABQ5S3A7_9CHLO|nr:hypothetical protein VaNZ11_007084 [Volvox africanus]
MQALLLLTLLAGVVLTHGNSLRGVNPDLASHYSGHGGTFTCISGIPKTIPFARVNDDYCDCSDGSDEPGTSACHNGRFYCRNLGHEPRLLASAFVDDGVCDCCDGADEAKGKCQNTCLQAAAVRKEALRGKIQLHEHMLKTKDDYVERARAFKEELQLKAPTIEEDIARQQAEVQNLKAEVTRLEEEEAARQAEIAAANQAAEEARRADEAQQTAVQAEDSGSGQGEDAESAETVDNHAEEVQGESQGEREETPEERGRRIASQWTSDPEAAAVEGQPEEHLNADDSDGGDDDGDDEGHYDGTMDDDAEGQFDYPDTEAEHTEYHSERHHRQQRPEGSAMAEERPPPSEWEDLMMFLDLVKQWAARWMHTFSKILRDGIREDVLAHRAKIKERSRSRQQRWESAKQAFPQPSRPRTAVAVSSSPPAASAVAAVATDPSSPLGLARTAAFTAERQLQQLQKDRENIGTFLNRPMDFGPDDIFLALANKCFSSYQTRWTYEVCMFEKAVQKEGNSNAVTVGRWYGFSEDYKVMYFSGGDECWNVGPRSMTVYLSCGLDERLSDGEEPSTCAYSAKMTTPAVCTQAELEELQQQMVNLEAFEDEVRAQIMKDEL